MMHAIRAFAPKPFLIAALAVAVLLLAACTPALKLATYEPLTIRIKTTPIAVTSISTTATPAGIKMDPPAAAETVVPGTGGAATATVAMATETVTSITEAASSEIGIPTSTIAAPAAGGQATVNLAAIPSLGRVLVDKNGMTLYQIKDDASGKISCTGACLENWIPLLVTDGPIKTGQGVGGSLSVLARRADGEQVLYNGQPLYTFIGDQAPGDVNGQGIGGVWFAAVP